MNVLVDGDLYKVSFNYFENEYPNGHKKYRKYTNCIITLMSDKQEKSLSEPDWNRPFVYIGQARCAPVDQFSKDIGRKIAFSRAVSCFENKHVRTVFWDAYFNRKMI